jgi:hypothetical protein
MSGHPKKKERRKTQSERIKKKLLVSSFSSKNEP